MDSENCVICGELLSSKPKVTVTKGMEKLIECSYLKNDGLFSASNQSVDLHVLCRKNYTRPSDRNITPSRTTTPFDFKTKCLFCECVCIKDNKFSKKKNKDVKTVISNFQGIISNRISL